MKIKMLNHQNTLCCFLLAFLCFVTTTVASSNGVFNLSVVFNAREYGQAFPVDSASVECTLAATTASRGVACFGGAARRFSFIRDTVAAVNARNNTNALVLSGGCSFWGSFFYTTFGSSLFADLMSPIGYHAYTIGLSDFHGGPGSLSTFITRYRSNNLAVPIAFLANNLDVSAEPLLNVNGVSMLVPYTIVNYGGRKVAIIGSENNMIRIDSSSGPNVIVNGGGNFTLTQMVQITLRKISNEHPTCNIIVWMVYHTLDVALDVAKSVTGIDLVLLSIFSWTDVLRALPPVTGSIFETHASTEQYPDRFVVAGSIGQGGARVLLMDMQFDDDGRVLGFGGGGERTITNSSVSPYTGDPTMWSNVLDKYAQIQATQTVPIAYTPTVIWGVAGTNLSVGSEGCRWTDCPMGRLIGKMTMHWCKDCDISVYNGGTIRASFGAGPISAKTVLTTLPFQANLAAFNLPGFQILNALFKMAEQKMGAGSYLQWSGLRFAWNPLLPPAQSMLEVQVFDRVLQKYMPLQTHQIYRVVTNSYLRGGGNGYTMFASTDATQANDYGPLESVAFTTYLRDLYFNTTVPSVSRESIQQCFLNATVPMDSFAGDCHVVVTTGASTVMSCPTDVVACSTRFALSASANADSDYVGAVVLSGLYALNNASLSTKVVCLGCSGLGTCANKVCRCFVPQTGLFKALDMTRGPDCSQVRNVLMLTSGSTAFFVALAAVTAALAVAVAVLLTVFRGSPIITSLTPALGLASCLGVLFAAASIYTMSFAVFTDSLCVLNLWFVNLGYTCIFGSMFVRTHRINEIFNQKSLKSTVITTTRLFAMLAAMILMDILLLVYMQVTAPLIVNGFAMSSEYSAFLQCSSDGGSAVPTFLLAEKIVMTLWGIYLAYSTRHVSENWNESAQIGTAIYNCGLLCGIVIPIYFLIGATYPLLVLWLRAITTFFVSTSSIVLLYSNRLYLLLIGAENTLIEQARKTQASSVHPSGGSKLSAMDEEERQKFETEITKLTTENTKLKELVQQLQVGSAGAQPVKTIKVVAASTPHHDV